MMWLAVAVYSPAPTSPSAIALDFARQRRLSTRLRHVLGRGREQLANFGRRYGGIHVDALGEYFRRAAKT